jgi:thioredoxin reductase (NADPH)
MLQRARVHEKIEFVSNVLVEEVLGFEQKEVTGLSLKHLKTGTTSILDVTGMFLGIGHEPNTKPFVGQIELDSDGYVVTHDDVHTRVEGVFACGDVQDRRYRQAITAAGSGCAAALEAEKYLEEQGR